MDWLSFKWAIEPDTLNALATHLASEQARPMAILDDDDEPRRPRAYRVIGGVARIDVIGVLVPGEHKFRGWFMSGTGYEWIANTVRAADADAEVERILLWIDSPGGVVCGGLHSAVRAIEGIAKPIEAYAYGMCCSAAMPIALATGRGNVIAAEGASAVACLGTISRIIKVESDRYKITEHRFVSKQTPRKGAPVDTKAGQEDRQALVDELGESFLNLVGRLRGLSEDADAVAERYGRGRAVAPREALAMGLFDRIETIDLGAAETTTGGTMAAHPQEGLMDYKAECARLTGLLEAKGAELKIVIEGRQTAERERDDARREAGELRSQVEAKDGQIKLLITERDDATRAQHETAAKREFEEHLRANDFTADMQDDYVEAYVDKHLHGNDRLMRIGFDRFKGKGMAGGPAGGERPPMTHGKRIEARFENPSAGANAQKSWDDRVEALAKRSGKAPSAVLIDIEEYGGEHRCTDADAMTALEAVYA